MEDKQSDFGKRLKDAFDNASNALIGQSLGVGKSSVTFYMQGRIPPPEKLIEIADITNCNLNWLLTGKGAKFVSQPKIAQGIIFQASKGGVGTSFAANFTAANLALKNFKVLMVTDTAYDTWNYLFRRDSKITGWKFTDEEVYAKTINKNLEYFVPKGLTHPTSLGQRYESFNFSINEINEKYDFVIFDVLKRRNPFLYPHNAYSENLSIEPILRKSKVLIPFQPFVSSEDNVEKTLQFIECENKTYPESGLLGIFFIFLRDLYDYELAGFEKEKLRLTNSFGKKFLNTSIDFHKEFDRKSVTIASKSLFKVNTQVHQNFSSFTDEILENLGFPLDKLKSIQLSA